MASSLVGLRVVLILAGAFIFVQGINIVFGGMQTLGWLGENNFFVVTNAPAFAIQDSHARFLGGLWLGIGSLFCLASLNVQKYRNALVFACCLVFLGGLARFSQMQWDVTFGPKIIGSLVAELVGMPILYFWISKTTREQRA